MRAATPARSLEYRFITHRARRRAALAGGVLLPWLLRSDGDGELTYLLPRRVSSKRPSRPKPKGKLNGQDQPWEPQLLANRRAVRVMAATLPRSSMKTGSGMQATGLPWEFIDYSAGGG